jgi:hypothetical protein
VHVPLGLNRSMPDRTSTMPVMMFTLASFREIPFTSSVARSGAGAPPVPDPEGCQGEAMADQVFSKQGQLDDRAT